MTNYIDKTQIQIGTRVYKKSDGKIEYFLVGDIGFDKKSNMMVELDKQGISRPSYQIILKNDTFLDVCHMQQCVTGLFAEPK